MTDNSTNNGEADAGSGSALIAFDGLNEEADRADGFDDDEEGEEEEEFTDPPEELAAIEDSAGSGVPGSGAVSGGFGFAGLALAIVSLTTSWTSGVVVSHSQYSVEMNAPSSGLTVQQELNMYESAWHTQAWWALVFAAAAVLFGAGAVLWPRIARSGGNPSWAKATATSAIIVGLIGVLLAVLTILGVFGGHLTAPSSST